RERSAVCPSAENVETSEGSGEVQTFNCSRNCVDPGRWKELHRRSDVERTAVHLQGRSARSEERRNYLQPLYDAHRPHCWWGSALDRSRHHPDGTGHHLSAIYLRQ